MIVNLWLSVDIRISHGFGFRALSMPMDTWMGHGEAGGSGFGSDFAIFVQTSSIAILIVS
jgi:hypothetical protein